VEVQDLAELPLLESGESIQICLRSQRAALLRLGLVEYGCLLLVD